MRTIAVESNQLAHSRGIHAQLGDRLLQDEFASFLALLRAAHDDPVRMPQRLHSSSVPAVQLARRRVLARRTVPRRRSPPIGRCSFVKKHAAKSAKFYSDDAGAYDSLPFSPVVVKHSLEEFGRGGIHTNGIESLWSILKRAHKGTLHKMSPKHLDRYMQEFAGRHNMRDQNTTDQPAIMRDGMDHKRLRYKDLVKGNGLESACPPASPVPVLYFSAYR